MQSKLFLDRVQITVSYYTCCDTKIKSHLNYYTGLYESLLIYTRDIDNSILFYYDFPLKSPQIFPSVLNYINNKPLIETEGDNILVYSLIEADFLVKGEKVVYDPQSGSNPISFVKTGSIAVKLIMVVNETEARELAQSSELDKIVSYFFDIENCFAFVIKMGAKGAILFESKTKSTNIPVYQTNKVWKIGSGDIFSAFFAYNWFNNEDLVECANIASIETATYCNSMGLSIYDNKKPISFEALTQCQFITKKVYLAGPFFNLSQKWMINEIWIALINIGLDVFSPYHDVGIGVPDEVVSKDIKGIDECSIMFAVLDGLDSGTLFEVGYAISKGKKVIGFVQSESKASLTMLIGTNCIIENDLTTAIYKTYWNATK